MVFKLVDQKYIEINPSMAAQSEFIFYVCRETLSLSRGCLEVSVEIEFQQNKAPKFESGNREFTVKIDAN